MERPEIIMLFENTEQAIMYGKQAGDDEYSKLLSARLLFEKQYEFVKNELAYTNDFERDINKLSRIATNIQYCNEALQSIPKINN